jgi:hypothetical protein
MWAILKRLIKIRWLKIKNIFWFYFSKLKLSTLKLNIYCITYTPDPFPHLALPSSMNTITTNSFEWWYQLLFWSWVCIIIRYFEVYNMCINYMYIVNGYSPKTYILRFTRLTYHVDQLKVFSHEIIVLK